MPMQITPASLPAGDVRIYEYGVRMDRNCAEALADQVAKGRRLYNQLVASIRDTVTAMNAYVIEQAGPEASALQASIEAFAEAFALARERNDEPEMNRIAGERRLLWRDLGERVKGARKANKMVIQAGYLNRIGKRTTCDTYQLRCAAVADGLGWATANATLDAALIAFKKSFVLGRAPRFARGDEKDQDTLTLQFTAAGGVPVTALLDGRHPELALIPDGGCGPRKYGSFTFRLGAATAKLQASGTWQYHRPLPADGFVGLARLIRRRVGKDTKWAVQLQVKSPTVDPQLEGRKPLVSVHFGWASDVEGRRVAGIADGADPGLATLLQLPLGVEEGIRRAGEYQSARDLARDAIVARIKTFAWDESLLAKEAGSAIEEHASGAAGPSGETAEMDPAAARLAKTIEALRAVRRPAPTRVAIRRIHRLCYLLRDIGQLPDWLETWRKEDRLRWQSAAHLARRARNLRKDFYRRTAHDLATRYSAILLQPLNLADAAKKVNELTGEKSEFGRKARAGRVVAALYELESSIRWAAAKNATAVLELGAETASRCAFCGASVSASGEDGQLLHCNGCGVEVDRKKNGAAVAWQVADSDIEGLVEQFWAHTLESRRAAADKFDEKKTKVANARRAALHGRMQAVERNVCRILAGAQVREGQLP